MSYRVEATHQAHSEIGALPGNMRQRVLRLLRELEREPYPHTSKPLDLTKAGIHLSEGLEMRRVRLDAWRIIYAVEEEAQLITVLTVRKRPPYRYEDLDILIKSLS